MFPFKQTTNNTHTRSRGFCLSSLLIWVNPSTQGRNPGDCGSAAGLLYTGCPSWTQQTTIKVLKATGNDKTILRDSVLWTCGNYKEHLYKLCNKQHSMFTNMKSLYTVSLIILLQFGFFNGSFAFLGLKHCFFDVNLFPLFFFQLEPSLSLFQPLLPLTLLNIKEKNLRSRKNAVTRHGRCPLQCSDEWYANLHPKKEGKVGTYVPRQCYSSYYCINKCKWLIPWLIIN